MYIVEINFIRRENWRTQRKIIDIQQVIDQLYHKRLIRIQIVTVWSQTHNIDNCDFIIVTADINPPPIQLKSWQPLINRYLLV